MMINGMNCTSQLPMKKTQLKKTNKELLEERGETSKEDNN